MMPKPNKKNNNTKDVNKSNFKGFGAEKIIHEVRPNLILYCDNFIFKFIILFLLIFLFAPLLAMIYLIQTNLLANFQMDISNLSFYAEMILIFLILIVIAKILIDVLEWSYANYVLTTNRIVTQHGFINKEKVTMPYSKVQDIDISQSILARILNVGDVTVYGGHENSDTILFAVPQPNKIEEIIVNQINNYQQVPSNNYGYNQQQNNYEHDQGYYNYYQENPNSYSNQQYNKPNYNQQYKDYNNPQQNNREYFGYNKKITKNNFNQNKEQKTKKYSDKWNKNKENYHKPNNVFDRESIMNKHQQQFKKYKK